MNLFETDLSPKDKKKKKSILQYFKHDAYFSLTAKITLEDLI